MTNASTPTRTIDDVMMSHLRQTKAAYNAGTRGVTYEDMKAAATRVLEMRRSIEQSTGRQTKTSVSRSAIAALMRSA